MNILFKLGEIIFKVFAIFLILLALLLEYLSKIRSFPKNEYGYSNDKYIGNTIDKYPHIKHYGY